MILFDFASKTNFIKLSLKNHSQISYIPLSKLQMAKIFIKLGGD